MNHYNLWFFNRSYFRIMSKKGFPNPDLKNSTDLNLYLCFDLFWVNVCMSCQNLLKVYYLHMDIQFVKRLSILHWLTFAIYVTNNILTIVDMCHICLGLFWKSTLLVFPVLIFKVTLSFFGLLHYYMNFYLRDLISLKILSFYT